MQEVSNSVRGVTWFPPSYSRAFGTEVKRCFKVLVAIDIGLILLTTVLVLLRLFDIIAQVPNVLMITRDWSLGETFNYLKWFSAIWLCGLLWLETRSWLYLAFMITFAVLLADDSLQIHETVGLWLVEFQGLQSHFGLRAQDLGELQIFAAMGVTVAFALVIGFWRGRPQDRGVGLALIGCIAGLVFCGLLLDMCAIVIAAALPPGLFETFLKWGVHLAEDGGEMVFASLALACVFGAWRSLRATPEHAPITWWS